MALVNRGIITGKLITSKPEWFIFLETEINLKYFPLSAHKNIVLI